MGDTVRNCILNVVPEDLIGLDDKLARSLAEQKPLYQFAEVRHLLRDVKGSLSDEVMAEREDRVCLFSG